VIGSSILILEAFKKQESVFEQGAQRVVTILTINEIRDKVESMEQKVRSVYRQSE
jgi:uncharacterized protein YqgV (UPF0045/DUF77 family)